MQDKLLTQGQTSKPKFRTTKRKVITAIIALLALFCVIDYIDGPMFWEIEAYKNKQVILNYVREKYPGEELKIVDQKYNTIWFSASKPFDAIVFKTNKGFEFVVLARDGELGADGYKNAEALFHVENTIKEFTAPRKLKPVVNCFYTSGNSNIRLYFKDQPLPYREAEWLYDFYLFWRENSCVSDYRFVISYEHNDDTRTFVFYSDSEELSKASFYSQFELLPPSESKTEKSSVWLDYLLTGISFVPILSLCFIVIANNHNKKRSSNH